MNLQDMSLKPYRLLIVGAGLTGSLTSALIKQNFPSEHIDVHIWEKSRGIGGRMTTNRSTDGQSTVDLGAQYITRARQYAERHKIFFDDLLHAGVLRPFPGMIEGATADEKSENFMVPNGINNMVKHFINLSDADVKLNTLCQEINACHKQDTTNDTWTVTSKDGTTEEFHGVILTMPVPQILQLGGTFQDYLKDYRSSLEQVQYSSRYALAIYYPEGEDTQFNVPWTAKYVNNHPCIRFVCVDSVKRGIDSSKSVLVHTSVPFGLAHLDSSIPEIQNTIYDYFQELFPGLPQPVSLRCIRWRYSQVYKSYPGQPGAVDVSSKPLLVLAGDGFVHSNFSGCVESAKTVLEKLKKHLVI